MVAIRLAEPGDSRRLWEWRNDALTRAVSSDQTPVPWADHEAWFARVLLDESRDIVIAVDSESTPIGMVRFDADEGPMATVSINLAPESRGKGLGREVLHEAIDWFRLHRPPAVLVAVVRSENVASRKLFAGEGFAIESESEGFLTLSRAD